MGAELEHLTLAELISLQSELVAEMNRRFQREVVVAFSDVVGSTAYFGRFGDAAGRALQQRHLDALSEVLPDAGGRIVDTAGDGAFLCFAETDAAARAFMRIANAIEAANRKFPAEHRLSTRVGIHHGSVLTDGVVVSGDAVNFCSRIAGSAAPGEIRLSKEASSELIPSLRARCRPLPPVALKGFAEPVSMMLLDWRDRSMLPTHARVRETKETILLPEKDTISFGRLDEEHDDGTRANDVVLRLPSEELTDRISRWHFELRTREEGLVCRAVSDGSTVVDGTEVPKGSEVPVRPGSVIQVAGVLTMMLVVEGAGVPSGARHKATAIR